MAGHPLKLLAKIVFHAALVVGALWMFVIALQLIKSGAIGLKPVLDSLSADGILGPLRLRLARAPTSS